SRDARAPPAVAGDDPELDLGRAEARVLGGDPDRAREGELAPSPERVAVDGRDHGLSERLELADDRLTAPGVFAALERRQLRELPDVGARDERLLARSGHDHDADGLVA